METKNIRGYTVYYNKEAKKGVDYLNYTLTFDEANSLFRNASYSGEIKFEDRSGRNYTLSRNNDGTFNLTKRKF